MRAASTTTNSCSTSQAFAGSMRSGSPHRSTSPPGSRRVARTIPSLRVSPTPISMAARRWRTAIPRNPDRRCSRASALPTRWTRTATLSARISTSKPMSRRSCSLRSRYAASTIRTSGAMSRGSSPRAMTSPTHSPCAAPFRTASGLRRCSSSTSRQRPPTSSTACRSTSPPSRQPTRLREHWGRRSSMRKNP